MAVKRSRARKEGQYAQNTKEFVGVEPAGLLCAVWRQVKRVKHVEVTAKGKNAIFDTEKGLERVSYCCNSSLSLADKHDLFMLAPTACMPAWQA